MRPRTILSLITVVVALTACTTLIGGVDTTTTTTEPPPPRDCVMLTPGTTEVDTGSPALDALTLSGEIFSCADQVVIVGEGDLNAVIAAAQLASAVGGPMLFPHPLLPSELGRLDPQVIHVVGDIEVVAPPGAEIRELEVTGAVQLTADALETTSAVQTPANPDSTSVIETVEAIAAGDRVVRPGTPPEGQTPMPTIDPDAVISGLARASTSGSVWLVDAGDPLTILLAASVMMAADAAVVALDPGDLFMYPEVGQALAGYPDRAARFIGSSPELDDWKLRTLVRGLQLPGGGFELFPEHIPRRLVAFYGHPRSAALGALGQVSPTEVLRLMREGGFLTGYPPTRCLPSPCRGTVPPGLLEGYAADGAHVVPTFNYIASVAQPRCRSHKFEIEIFQEGIDVAAANDGYVVFDLQPGAEDFLSHAMFYEEALREPHVGLALDPEWRCGWPGQTEFNRIGTATAAEINEVIDWLADLVNQEALPQKLLLIQQFRMDMIQDRDQLRHRPEVQVVIQMDGEGQGNLTVKENTWRGVTAGTEDDHWMWGWKNFFVRDHPDGPYSPAQTIDRQPVPVYISYQ